MKTKLSSQALSQIKYTDTIALLGGSGFVGSSLLKLLLSSSVEKLPQIRLATRNTANSKLQEIIEPFTPQTKITIEKCDHLNRAEVQKILEGSDSIINLAGLAWQHPGGKPLPKKELFTQEVFQNAVSALLMASVLEGEQRMVWTSTSAIDGMFARLLPEQKAELQNEAKLFATTILNELQVKEKKEVLFTSLEKIIDSFAFKTWPPFPSSKEKACFAFEYSYAYSKYVGQLILEEMSQKNIRALKISDVYGPGQDISATILDPLLPARRIQRYIAAFREISQGNVDWIPNDGGNIYGLFRDKNNQIAQISWSDWVFPTHIDDVCEIIVRSLAADIQKTVLNVNGNRISNRELMETTAGYFKTPVTFNKNEPPQYKMVQNSEDLPLLGMTKESLIPFSVGMRRWVEQ